MIRIGDTIPHSFLGKEFLTCGAFLLTNNNFQSNIIKYEEREKERKNLDYLKKKP